MENEGLNPQESREKPERQRLIVRNFKPHPLSRVPYLVPLIVLCGAIAFGLCVYFLAKPLSSSSLPPSQDSKVSRLETRLSSLELRQSDTSAKGNDADQAYKLGLKQHQDLFDDARAELALAQQHMKEAEETLKKANEVTQNTREAASAFLVLFGIVAALIVGQGYVYLNGWKEQAEESLSEVVEVRPDITAIKEVRQSLETELPNFLSKAREVLDIEDPTSAVRQQDVALTDEIDHFMFLNTQQRFRVFYDKRAAAEYLESLRMAARGHLARRANWEAMSRLDEYLKIVGDLNRQFEGVAEKKYHALAYSYRAVAAYQLMKVLSSEASWINEVNAARIEKLRVRALDDLRKAQAIYPDRNYGDYVEALLRSSYFLPSSVMSEKATLEGHRYAVTTYKTLSTADTPSRKRRASIHNLICCLKRIASITGESAAYSALLAEIRAIPSDQELYDHASGSGELSSELHLLWQAMLADEQLFADGGKIKDIPGYIAAWQGILEEKLIRRNWRDDLAELRKRNPKMNQWAINL